MSSPSTQSTDAPAQRHSFVSKIVSFSAHNRLLVILFCLGAVVFAIHTMRNIRLDAIPDLSDTQVIVYTKWDRSPDILDDPLYRIQVEVIFLDHHHHFPRHGIELALHNLSILDRDPFSQCAFAEPGELLLQHETLLARVGPVASARHVHAPVGEHRVG